jgi:hypothetical protein
MVYNKKAKISEPTVVEPSFAVPDEGDLENFKQLKQSLNSNAPDWEVLESGWRRTAMYRQIDVRSAKSVDDVVREWPKYNTNIGHLLVICSVCFMRIVSHKFSKLLRLTWTSKCSTQMLILKVYLQAGKI